MRPPAARKSRIGIEAARGQKVYGVPPQAIARVLTGGGSDAINGRSADGGALGAAALDTSSQELLI
jgi:hypothetical protein